MPRTDAKDELATCTMPNGSSFERFMMQGLDLQSAQSTGRLSEMRSVKHHYFGYLGGPGRPQTG